MPRLKKSNLNNLRSNRGAKKIESIDSSTNDNANQDRGNISVAVHAGTSASTSDVLHNKRKMLDILKPALQDGVKFRKVNSDNLQTEAGHTLHCQMPSTEFPVAQKDVDYQCTSAFKFNPPNYVWQAEICRKINLRVLDQIEYNGQGCVLSDNYNIIRIKPDGNCLARAISMAITGVEGYHDAIRRGIVNHEKLFADDLQKYLWADENFDEHIERFSQESQEAHELDLFAAAGFLNTPIYVHQPIDIDDDNFQWCKYSASTTKRNEEAFVYPCALYLKNVNGDHLDLIISMSPSPSTTETDHRSVVRAIKSYDTKKFEESERKRKAMKSETSKQNQSRLEKVKLNMQNIRSMETSRRKRSRVGKVRLSMQKIRSMETPGQKQSRLQKDSRRYKNARDTESSELAESRRTRNKFRRRTLRSREQPTKINERLSKQRKRQENLRKHNIVKQLEKNVKEKTNTSFLCVSDLRYHSRGNCQKVSLKGRSDEYLSHLILNDGENSTLPKTMNADSNYYVCNSCHRSLLREYIPSCNELKHQFLLPSLPDEFSIPEMQLNKCEAHLLKLIIPFIRVAHIPRSAEFKVLGPVINVQADISPTFEKILPINQDLIPVALKRRPEYRGSYIEEVVSKSKLKKYFWYFKTHNPLFSDVEFNEDTLDEMIRDFSDDIEVQDDWKNQMDGSNDEALDEKLNNNEDDFVEDEAIPDVNESVAEADHNEDQSLPEYLTEVAADTIIDPLTTKENRDSISDLLANAMIEREKHKRQLRMQKVSVAPTASSNFKYWDTAKNLEEKAFPHLFPTGTGGYLSTHESNGVGFANYVKQRIFGLDPRFRNDTTYLFFLYIVKETIEIKRSIGTFFRKGRANKNKYTVDFLLGCNKAEIERHDVQYKAFKAIRGTDPYFQHQKTKLMAMIRQLGAPQLFLTLSAAEVHWHDLLRDLYFKEAGEMLTNDEIDAISRPELNKLISRNTVYATVHFNNRIQMLFTALTKPGILSTYKVKDHFYRVEFQQRGAPHIHAVLWLQDEKGISPALYNGCEESKAACVEFIDSIISGQLPDENDPLYEKVAFFQTHNHTFTCKKKSKKIVLLESDGHGILDGGKKGAEITMDSCRFKFPKFPMSETMIIDSPDKDATSQELLKWRNDYNRVRKYLLRQCYENPPDFYTMTYEQFLDAVGLTHDDYIDCLQIAVSSNKSAAMVFLKRELKDLFTNNYNPTILGSHQANMDLSYVVDEYACIAYILGYVTKGESGLSKLLQQIENESAQYGRTPGEKMKQFSRALDTSREVSRPEAVYRMLGLHMCDSTRQHKFIQAGDPNKRDSLIRSNLDKLDKDENPFYNSIIDYYIHRPDNLEDISLAEFVRDYNIVYRSKLDTDADEMFDMEENTSTGGIGNVIMLKKNIGRIRKRRKQAIVRYYVDKRNDIETMRNMLVLFHPFRDENAEIHLQKSIEAVYNQHKDDIENVLKEFESNRDLVDRMEKAIAEHDDLELDNEEDDTNSENPQTNETTTEEELQHFLSIISPRLVNDIDIAQKEKVCEMVRKLNSDQRRIFDDIIERMLAYEPEGTNNPSISDKIFYLYIGGKAGTGKTFLLNTLKEALKLVLMKSGDDLNKPNVLVLSPTATAANLIGGDTIEGAMGFSRNDETETYQIHSNNATAAHKLSQVKVIFIDEISMCGANKFHQIHKRLETLFSPVQGKPCAGITVICTGDFLQLPPVLDSWIFEDNKRDLMNGLPNRPNHTAPNKWQCYFKMYELQQKMRSIEDPEFSALCDRVGTDSLSETDLETLRQRIQPCPHENDNDKYKDGKLAIIVKDNKTREVINNIKLQLINGDASVFNAVDKAINIPKYDEKAVSNLSVTTTSGLPGTLNVKIDCPVMLTNNVDKSDGLTNGVRGYVTDIDPVQNIIWVKFPPGIGTKAAAIGKRKYNFNGLNGSVPIKQMTSKFRVPKTKIRIKRTQFPLVLCYAMTSHKAQGQTIDSVIIDFQGTTTAAKGSFYVALTRAKKLENIYLRSFDKSMIKCCDKVIKELNRLRTRARYHFYKHYMFDDVYEYPESEQEHEVKIAYLNINGLLHAEHIQNLQADLNLNAVDVLCIAETKLSPTVNNDSIQLDGFQLISRFDVQHNSMGLAVYKKTDSLVNIKEIDNYSNNEIQIAQYTIDDISAMFTYIHPNSVHSGLDKLGRSLGRNSKQLVMGDMNLDAYKNDKRRRLDAFCADHNLDLCDLRDPTHNNTWIDHILLSEDFVQYASLGNYKNLYSDHNAITIRFSYNASDILQ